MPGLALQTGLGVQLRGISRPAYCFDRKSGSFCAPLSSSAPSQGALIKPQLRGTTLCRTQQRATNVTKAAQQTQKIKSNSKQSSTGKGSGQVEIDEVPLLDRFHVSVTGFPFPLGPFFQRRTIRKEVRCIFVKFALPTVLWSLSGIPHAVDFNAQQSLSSMQFRDRTGMHQCPSFAALHLASVADMLLTACSNSTLLYLEPSFSTLCISDLCRKCFWV